MVEPYILILNGPNLNLLGHRETEIYGHRELEEIIDDLRTEYPDIRIEALQSNHEGVLIDAIHDSRNDDECLGIVLNAGAYSHTSLALADAIAGVPTPVVEVHISNIYNRESIRRSSYISPVCIGTITGFGPLGYSLAVRALLSR